MTQITIGTFRRDNGSWKGRIQTLGLDAPLYLAEVDPRENEGKCPDMRVHLGDNAEGFPIGEARHRPGGPGGFHIAVRIDGPLFPRPIDAMLLTAGHGDVHYLVWNRPPEPASGG